MISKTILVTGTLGFIFSNFIRKVTTDYPEYRWIGVDKAVLPHNLDNQFTAPNYTFYLADISDSHMMDRIFEIEKPDIVIGGAAESFVDNSITNVTPFLHTNVLGTQVLIDQCLKHKVERYVHISTDEVYGQKLSKDAPGWTEDEPLAPRNPYAASKACAEHIVRAAHETHGLQYQMTRSCNVFGPRQKHDNLIPHVITSILKQKPIKIHGNGTNFRQYVFVEDKIDAIMSIIKSGALNETYNIGANNFFTNLEIVTQIGNLINWHFKTEFIADRKAHDFGYVVNTKKVNQFWTPSQKEFIVKLYETVEFYLYQSEVPYDMNDWCTRYYDL